MDLDPWLFRPLLSFRMSKEADSFVSYSHSAGDGQTPPEAHLQPSFAWFYQEFSAPQRLLFPFMKKVRIKPKALQAISWPVPVQGALVSFCRLEIMLMDRKWSAVLWDPEGLVLWLCCYCSCIALLMVGAHSLRKQTLPVS